MYLSSCSLRGGYMATKTKEAREAKRKRLNARKRRQAIILAEKAHGRKYYQNCRMIG